MSLSTAPPTVVAPSTAAAEVDVNWGDLLGFTADPALRLAAAASSSSCTSTPPPLPVSPNLSSAASFPTPASLPSASPISRTYSQTSASSSLQVALATLKSPGRKSAAQRQRSHTAHTAAPYPVPGAAGPPYPVNPAAPTSYRGPGLPSVLLRSISDSACPTQASLAASFPPALSPPADLPQTPLTPSPFLPDYAPPTIVDEKPEDIVVPEHDERKPKKTRRKPAGHVPRPMNSFMLYRSAQLKELGEYRDESGTKLQQADLSRLIAVKWREESAEVREGYTRRALQEKELHALRYPDYAFRPKATRRASAKGKAVITSSASPGATSDSTLPTPPPAPVASGLVGANPLSELLPEPRGICTAGDPSASPHKGLPGLHAQAAVHPVSLSSTAYTVRPARIYHFVGPAAVLQDVAGCAELTSEEPRAGASLAVLASSRNTC
ncbi:hypothetical protein JCM10449v2_006251 [Rhodotorula kratochvilovae]